MTEAGWTQEPPKLPGWYWWRHSHLARVHITRVNDRLEVVALNELFNVSDSDHVDECDGQWLGPITPDSYQQGRVAGIKQGIEKLREREKFYTEQEAISEGQMRLTRGLQRNESSCCIHELEKLAQAAQDEKGGGDGKDCL